MSDDGERVRRLEAEVAELRARLDRVEGTMPTWRPVVPQGAPVAVPPVREARKQGRPERPTPISLEERLGANWLAKAGIVVLVLGVVFFLKLAFDAGWIGLPMRIALGVVGGVVLALAGDVLLRKRRFGDVYPQVLTGGGIVIVYFSVFAAYTFPSYRRALGVSLELDAVLLGLIAIVAAGYAAWRDAPTFAAGAGGLVAVTVLFAEEWTAFALGYLVAAVALLLFVAAFRRWVYVPLFLVPAAFVPLGGFFFGDMDPYLVGAGGVAVAVPFIASGFRAHPETGGRWVPWTVQVIVGLLTWVLWLGVLDQAGRTAWQGWLTLAGAFAFAGLRLATTRARDARIGWSATALTLLLVWPPIHFDGVAVVYAWSGLVFVGAMVTLWRRTHWSDVGLLVAAVWLSLHLASEEMPRLLDERLTFGQGLAVFAAATVACAAAWVAMRGREGGPLVRARVLLGLLVLLPIGFFGAAVEGYGIAIAWTVEAVLLVILGFALRIVDLRYAAFGVFGIVLVRVFVVDIADLEPIYRVITFLVVGALLLAVAFLFARRKRNQPAAAEREAAMERP